MCLKNNRILRHLGRSSSSSSSSGGGCDDDGSWIAGEDNIVYKGKSGNHFIYIIIQKLFLRSKHFRFSVWLCLLLNSLDCISSLDSVYIYIYIFVHNTLSFDSDICFVFVCLLFSVNWLYICNGPPSPNCVYCNFSIFLRIVKWMAQNIGVFFGAYVFNFCIQNLLLPH